VFGVEITQQAVFYGVVYGLIYAVFAAGFVLVYRSTGILNFAQGEIGAFGVALFALFHVQYDVPYWFAFVIAVVATAIIGMVIELTVVRRLFDSPRLVLLIATVGIAQLLLFLRVSLPKIDAGGGFPLPFTGKWQPTDSLVVLPREVLVLLVAPLVILLLGLFITRTTFGLAVRASSSNSDTARVYGISVKRTSTIVWTIAAAFAAITGILVAPLLSVTPGNIVAAGAVAIGPALLLRALVVALIARMVSLPMTIVGGIAVGVFERIVIANVDSREQSIVDLYLFIAALVLVLVVVRNRRDDTGWSLSAQIKPIPERLRGLWYVRRLPLIGFAVLFGFFALLPLFLSQRSQEFLWTEIVIYALVAMSITPLAGWAGQLSLGQFAFVGLGALTMVLVRAGLDIPVPFDLWDMSVQLAWLPAVIVSTLVGIAAAIVIGLPALRARGLFLAVITLAFAVMCSNWLFRQPMWTGTRFGTTTPRIDPPVLGSIDFSNRRALYYLCFGVLVVTTIVVARLRRTGIGRSMIAVRDNEDMAAASTVSPSRIKVMSFAVSGGIAALGGCLLITLREQVTPTQAFTPEDSLLVVATAVIGGLGSIAGPILGALWVRGLPVVFSNTAQVRLFTSSIGLLILLMYFPGGLMQIAYKLRDAVLTWADARLADRKVPEPVPAIAKAVPRGAARHVTVADGAPWLSVRDVSVRFGGNHAVDHASIHVRAGELVGLIGTNGAGKSTLMNAIGGFVRCSGTVELFGQDVTRMAAYRRHRAGLGRGFQAARLYPALTVRETIMVALEARERSWLVPSMTGVPPSPADERRKRNEASELIEFLGLGRYADEFVANLSTGTRRIAELGTLLAVDARVLLLDEPTGGVAQREAEAFGPLIVRIQRELGAAMVVIEHDMPLIMSISDRVYCLEAGTVIAEGPPAAIRDDARVIASYLGTSEQAIQRSGERSGQRSGAVQPS
jgi:ABC-type branched-subunit amino acid transport system permease subunit/ABC-type branched-subunit amino acid transport system ATPase component